ncbi:MAG: SpoIIE family protein phosphatase [Acidobacteriota bacterium]
MSVRAKLFLLLLALSVLPILFLRLNGHFAVKHLTQDLIYSSQRTLVAKAKSQMLTMVEDHAELWRRQGMLLEQTLRLQASEVEKALAAQSPPELSARMAAAYRNSMSIPMHETPGQLTVFADGHLEASAAVKLSRRFDGRDAAWYQLAMRENGAVWTAPVIDPLTRRIGVTLSVPVRDASGRVVGVTAVMAPLAIGGMSTMHTSSLSERLRTYLVAFDHPDASVKGLRVIGRTDPQDGNGATEGGHGQGRRMGMMGLAEPVWLTPDDPQELRNILDDLAKGTSEVRQAELGTKDYIWAYAPVGVKGMALVLSAPKTDVTAEATRATDYIKQRVQSQMGQTLAMSLAALVVVGVAALYVSRSFTRPLSDLARMADRLGEGDFTVRVTPSGGREFMELGKVFNEMVPELEESTRLKQAMVLAREVHQRLIPEVIPAVAGLDLAAVSIPCQETGGDSFDVIPAAHDNPDRTALLVGDVTGHGLDAALLMATARAYLRMRVRQPGTPAQVMNDVNRFLSLDTGDTGRFMTLFYLEANPRSGTMRWVRAGHDPAILYRAATDDFQELGGPGIPLGVLDDRTFQENTQPMPQHADVLLIGSDGLWEARGPDGSMFGKERVRAILREHAASGARDILDTLLAAWNEFRGDEPAEDDVTLMVIKTVNTGDA